MEALYNQNKVQRSTEAHLPAAILQQLEHIASQGFDPYLILQHYTAVFDQGQPRELSHAVPAPPSVLDDAPSPTARHGHYGCPWCGSVIKLEKDFIRHVKEKCCLQAVLRCPNCPKTYTRKHRLANHHKAAHPNHCGPGPCSHVNSATVKLPNAQTLGCGFCLKTFHADLHGYLRHVIDHYRGGALLSNWQAGPDIPSPNGGRPFSPPPKINLTGSLGLVNQESVSDFSALRSGFGLDDSPCRTHSAISNDSTLFDPMDYTTTDINTKANWDSYFNPTNIAFINSTPDNNDPHSQQHCMNNPAQLDPSQDDFTDLMHYINNDTYFINNNFVDPSIDDVIPQSQAVTTACAQLMDMDMEPAVEAGPAVFNPTPPLDFTKDHRTSMSGRLLRKFQSLSPLRTEF